MTESVNKNLKFYKLGDIFKTTYRLKNYFCYNELRKVSVMVRVSEHQGASPRNRKTCKRDSPYINKVSKNYKRDYQKV